MELNWFESLIFGLISGFSEFLPVSSLAHQALYLKLIGHEADPLLRLCASLGALTALLVVMAPVMQRLRREKKIARLPKNRRRRPPDPGALAQLRLRRSAVTAMLAVFLLYPLVYDQYERLWLLAIFLGINGIVLYIPQYLPGANKGPVSLSALDGLLVGLAAGCGIVPGFSRIGFAQSIGRIRGFDRQYAVELALMVSIPALLVLSLIDGAAVYLAGNVVFSAALAFKCFCAAAASFGASYLGIFLVRFLSVKVGYSGFAYYCWGAALFALIIYLI